MQFKTIVFGILGKAVLLGGCAGFFPKQAPIAVDKDLSPLRYKLQNERVKSFPHPLPTLSQADLIMQDEQQIVLGQVTRWDLDGDGVCEVLEFKDGDVVTRYYDLDGDGKIDLVK